MLYSYSLKMHIGKSSIAIKKEGDIVERGDLIAASDGEFSSNLHSSVYGYIRQVSNTEIVIESDKNQASSFKKIKKTNSISEASFEAGIIGAGGAGFPTHIKLQNKIEGGVVFANAAECEPNLEHNIEAIKDNPEILIKGLNYILTETKAAKCVIAIKAKHVDVINILKTEVKKYCNISILELNDIYPVGEERAIIHAYSGKWIKPNELTHTHGFSVFNVETISNIVSAIELQKPVIDKDISIAGDFIETDKKIIIYKNIAIGTPLLMITKNLTSRHLIGDIIVGGANTGKSESLENVYINKTMGGIIFTIDIPIFKYGIGLLVCACSANEERLIDIANKMRANILGVAFCKNIDFETKKCLTPGVCPGQAEAIMKLKKNNVKRILIANCSDCSNTVMSIAPNLDIGVYHSTDHVCRTINKKLTRRL